MSKAIISLADNQMISLSSIPFSHNYIEIIISGDEYTKIYMNTT